MENTIEQNKEMTAEQSLSLITETLNKSRKEITRNSGKYFIFWGVLLTFFSVLSYLLWKITDCSSWSYLWFAMPVIGFPLARVLRKKDGPDRVQNDVSRIVSGIWTTFAIFACSIPVFTILYIELTANFFGAIGAIYGLTAGIVLVFGFAESISGVALKNWFVKISGFVTGIGGLAIHYIAGAQVEQMFIFTFAGIVLMATGLIVKFQYK